MIKHVVCWNINEEVNKAETAIKIKEKLTGLKEGIKEIKHIEVGLNDENAPETNHDIILISEFDSLETLNTYLKHPAHLQVVSEIKHYLKDRVAVDFIV